MSRKYSQEQIIEELQEVSQQLDRTLVGRDVNEHCSFSRTTCYDYFSSFSEAKRQAGIDVVNAKDVSDQQYLDELKRLADELGRTPTSADLAEKGKYSIQPYQRRWGSWSNALDEVGMKPRQRAAVSDDELIDELQRLADEIGRTPSVTDINQHSEFSESTYMKRFDGITAARVEAGLNGKIDRTERVEFTCEWCGETEEKIPSEAKSREYCSSTCANKAVSGVTDEQLLETLRELAEDLGRAPTGREFNQHTEYWHCSLGHRFGSYSQAIREIGYEPKCAKDYSREELVDVIKKMDQGINSNPKTTDLAEFDAPKTPYVFQREFGSWAAALQEAGVEPTTVQLKTIPKEELMNEYTQLADELGYPPSYTEVDDLAKYSSAAYESTFGSFLEAKAQAGFDPVATDNFLRGEEHPHWKDGEDARYGKNWQQQRQKALERDRQQCQRCGISAEEHQDKIGMDLHVHHLTPAREFDDHEERNKLPNLITLCAACHRTWESMPIQPQVAGGAD
jgi:ferredoxin